jgi:ribosome maturation factor RimP
MFSKKIEKFLDENDIIKERYYLEVQSKGIKI